MLTRQHGGIAMNKVKNRFSDFYERVCTNPQAMKAEMEWIRGQRFECWKGLEEVGDIGRADAGDDLPFIPFVPQTADYSPRPEPMPSLPRLPIFQRIKR